MDKLKMHSPDMTQENIKKIIELFPNCKTEARDENGKLRLAIDFDQLKQELSDTIVEGPQERYHLNWPGKREALLTANSPTTKTLRPINTDDNSFAQTENIFIEGDNLDVLKILQESYLGKIKMIYIDPPYNRGDDLLYKDDFAINSEGFLIETSQIDESKNKLSANTESNGRFHSDWLTHIYMRLKLSRNLLSEDGVIFISIDDNEVHNLRKLCDEIFGAENAIVPLIWSLPRGINAGHVSRAHEYVLVYAKNKSYFPLFQKVGDDIYSVERCNKKVDKRHPATEITFPAGIRYVGPDKTITGCIEGSERIEIEGELHFSDGKLAKDVTLKAGWTMKNMILSWLRGEEVYDSKGQLITEFFFKENGKLYSRKKITFESPKSILFGVSDTQKARVEIADLLGSPDVFPYPKPTDLIQRLLELVTQDGDLILDFYAGSGTTAHAVFKELQSKKLNFILVQLPELISESDPDSKAAIEFCDSHHVPRNIAEITKKRIEIAAQKLKEMFPDKYLGKDLGVRFFKLASSNYNDVFQSVDNLSQEKLFQDASNIKKSRNSFDVIFQVLLDFGLPLSSRIKIEHIAGSEIFIIEDNSLIVCLGENLTGELLNEICEYKPLRVVFRDEGFESDSLKVNAEQVIKQKSPITELRVI